MTANATPLPKASATHPSIPRRACLDQNHHAELMIRTALLAVESLGADPLLTDAVTKLGAARDLVADWLEGGQKPESPRMLTLQEQVAQMLGKWPQAVVQAEEFTNGPYKWTDHLVSIPHFPLPPGYDRPTCTVYFVVPDGYPFRAPERFYTDALRLENGDVPYFARGICGEVNGATAEKMGFGFEAPPGTMIWFWKVDSWHHIQNTLKTYVSVIKARLDKPFASVREHFGD